jgi:hypothetical protein
MSCNVITQIKGIFGKFPKISIEHKYNIIYIAHMWKYVSTNYKVDACILHVLVLHGRGTLLQCSKSRREGEEGCYQTV